MNIVGNFLLVLVCIVMLVCLFIVGVVYVVENGVLIMFFGVFDFGFGMLLLFSEMVIVGVCVVFY